MKFTTKTLLTLSVYVFLFFGIFKNTNICHILHMPRGLFVFFTPLFRSNKKNKKNYSHYSDVRMQKAVPLLNSERHNKQTKTYQATTWIVNLQTATYFLQMTPETSRLLGRKHQQWLSSRLQKYMCVFACICTHPALHYGHLACTMLCVLLDITLRTWVVTSSYFTSCWLSVRVDTFWPLTPDEFSVNSLVHAPKLP